MFVLIAAGALYSYKSNVLDAHLESLQSDISAQNQQLTASKKRAADAALNTAATFKEWRQLEAIMELEERRRDQTRLLVELEQLVPKTDAWLLTLKHDKGLLTVEGIAKDKEPVSRFMTQLENARHIDRNSVYLTSMAQNMVINGINLTRFKIVAQTRFPQPPLLDSGIPELGLPPREKVLEAVGKAAPDLTAAIKTSAGAGRAL
jgi:Tfp pilus assembly protein PilN